MRFGFSEFRNLPGKGNDVEVSTSRERVITTKEAATEQKEKKDICISPEHFVEQIGIENIFSVENEKEQKTELIGYTEIIPDRLTSDEYVVYVGGFGTNAFAYDAQLYELARRGRKVIYCNPHQGLPVSDEMRTCGEEHAIPTIIQRKAEELRAIFEEKGIEHADIVGHSQGGAVASMFTALMKTRVKKLILDTPAGLSGKMTARELMLRSMDEALQEYIFAYKKKKTEGNRAYMNEWRGRLRYNMRGDDSAFLWNMRSHIRALAETDISELLRGIHIEEPSSNQDQTEVILVTAHNDRIFRTEEIEKTLGMDPFGNEGSHSIIDRWTMYAHKDTGHGYITKNDPQLLSTILEERDAEPNGNAKIIADCIDFTGTKAHA